MKQLENRIVKTDLVEWKKVQWLQNPRLKDMSPEAFQKLKNSLIRNNFIQTFNIWDEGNDSLWFLDGHHRERALKELEKEGYSIPDRLPANFIYCRDRKEAIKLVLVYSSIYAKITEVGLSELLAAEGLDMDDIKMDVQLPEIDFDKFEEDFKKQGMDIPEEEQAIKPFKKTHVLLSFPPSALIKVQPYLEKILKIEEIEYEQSSN